MLLPDPDASVDVTVAETEPLVADAELEPVADAEDAIEAGQRSVRNRQHHDDRVVVTYRRSCLLMSRYSRKRS